MVEDFLVLWLKGQVLYIVLVNDLGAVWFLIEKGKGIEKGNREERIKATLQSCLVIVRILIGLILDCGSQSYFSIKADASLLSHVL